ncbi:MAG: hypothetical protein R2734_11860 [Nocardioides sp.]
MSRRPSPEQIIQIPTARCWTGADTFTIEIRYRTKEKFGNITQKGQSASRGGQWKIRTHRAYCVPACSRAPWGGPPRGQGAAQRQRGGTC